MTLPNRVYAVIFKIKFKKNIKFTINSAPATAQPILKYSLMTYEKAIN